MMSSLLSGAKQVIVDAKNEADSEAHQMLRQYAGNQHHGKDEEPIPGIRHPGATGVIYCTDRAQANGFTSTDPDWANLGQGAPEVGDIPGGPPRPKTIDLSQWGDDVNEYGPAVGVKELREAVAKLYNAEYRKGLPSQYTYENVCIVPGGRAGMARIAAVIGDVYCGYQIPEYTTYSEVLSVFKRLVPIPTALDAKDKYKLNLDQVKREIVDLSLNVVVASNPRNPTGQCIEGEDLRDLVNLSRDKTTIVLDEFYSWYMYPDDEKDLGTSLSGARYVDDVNEDPVVIINGLTKGFRLPGWRVCWVVAPKSVISAISQSGSFLDGGASHPLQMAAIPLLDYDRVQQDKISLQRCFRQKRDHVLARLEALGLKVAVPPKATFYIWLDLSGLEPPLNNGLVFFEELLREKTICVPGLFFDINPNQRRNLFHSPCHHFVRLSFGPKMETLDKGLDAIGRVLEKHKNEPHLMGVNFAQSLNKAAPGTNHDAHT
ncbi:pyridoxal phosphate-dependent transferase [Naematelia encephala]|uniref:Pyridoxal phosphate-dependent transferase n=1 Tax=Naematelia encephala TaxID=71784 RepID=A0A1Y2B1A4_9TREE|nr:pyridoxal phosphate-dependent transferase [Naematelia encephala]